MDNRSVPGNSPGTESDDLTHRVREKAMNAGCMRRMVVNTAICFLVFIANTAGASGDLYISWSDSEYVEVLTVNADTTATCYVLVQDGGAEFVGYEFWIILSDDLEVIAHQPALLHAVDALTTPDEFHSGPNYVFLRYLVVLSLIMGTVLFGSVGLVLRILFANLSQFVLTIVMSLGTISSTAYFTRESIPASLRPLAGVNPVSFLCDSLRSGTTMGGGDYGSRSMGMLTVLTVVALALALVCSRQLERQTEGL